MNSDKDQSIFAGALFTGVLCMYLFISHEKNERSKRVKGRWEKIHQYIGKVSRSHEKPISNSHVSNVTTDTNGTSTVTNTNTSIENNEISHGKLIENACRSDSMRLICYSCII